MDTRGHWHCLYHRSPFSNVTVAGGHAFSLDGHEWHVASAPAYSSTQEYQQGGARIYGKRERPHLLFDPVTGKPTHLTTGVCLNPDYRKCNDNPWPGYFDYTLTSVAPIGQ